MHFAYLTPNTYTYNTNDNTRPYGGLLMLSDQINERNTPIFERIHHRLMMFHPAVFILIMVGLNHLIILLGSVAFKFFSIDRSAPGLSDPTINYFHMVIMAPFVETIVFQWLPIMLLAMIASYLHRSDKVRISAIVISAFVFGSIHFLDYNFSIVKFAVTALNGIILGYAFEAYRYEGRRAFLNTFLIHMLTNSLSLLPTLFIPI